MYNIKTKEDWEKIEVTIYNLRYAVYRISAPITTAIRLNCRKKDINSDDP
jgi:hypothetical protein